MLAVVEKRSQLICNIRIKITVIFSIKTVLSQMGLYEIVPICLPMQYHMPRDCNLDTHLCEDLKFTIHQSAVWDS